MPSLFDVDPQFVVENKQNFDNVYRNMANKFMSLPDNSKMDSGRQHAEIAELAMFLSNNPSGFEELRDAIKKYNALQYIGIHGAMPRQYNAFHRLDAAIQGKPNLPPYMPWLSPKIQKQKPIYAPMIQPDPKRMESAIEIMERFYPRALMEI